MPTLPIDAMCADLDDHGERLVRAAFKGKSGTLRASKPFRTIDPDADDALFKACANYVWRMLCFDLVASRPHNCMPVTADWDLRIVLNDHSIRPGPARTAKDKLDATITRAESALPPGSLRGALSWRGLI
jgi:hypothetical protein